MIEFTGKRELIHTIEQWIIKNKWEERTFGRIKTENLSQTADVMYAPLQTRMHRYCYMHFLFVDKSERTNKRRLEKNSGKFSVL